MKLVMVASVLVDWMFASGWGNCWVADHGILTELVHVEVVCAMYLREHHMQRYAQLLCAVQVTEAGRVGNDGVGDECLLELVWQLVLDAHPFFDGLLQRIHAEAIASLDARSPCPA